MKNGNVLYIVSAVLVTLIVGMVIYRYSKRIVILPAAKVRGSSKELIKKAQKAYYDVLSEDVERRQRPADSIRFKESGVSE